LATTIHRESKAFLFGSQCALKSVEDFTEFEQRGAYFDTVGCHFSQIGFAETE
jgi:hypothetical protein